MHNQTISQTIVPSAYQEHTLLSTATALLVVDLQVGLIEGQRPVYEGHTIIARIKQLIERARAAGAPVVFMQDKDVAPPGSDAWQIHPALEPQPHDLVIPKAYADSFYHTDLHAQLQAQRVGRVVVCGCTTDQCVDMTSRRAVALGYDVVLVGDAHTTTDNRLLSAAHCIEYYNLMLDGFGAEDGFGAGQHEIVVQETSAIEFQRDGLQD